MILCRLFSSQGELLGEYSIFASKHSFVSPLSSVKLLVSEIASIAFVKLLQKLTIQVKRKVEGTSFLACFWEERKKEFLWAVFPPVLMYL